MNRYFDVSSIILAAGNGTRIGIPKLMLNINGVSYLTHIVNSLKQAKILNIVCVVNSDTFDWAKNNADDNIRIAINPDIKNGMISSIYSGLKQLQDYKGIMIIPVDHPYVCYKTYSVLINAFQQYPDAIIKPSWNNKSGHPIIIPYKLTELIQNNDITGGLNCLIKQSGIKQIFIPVSDEGIVKNINTYDDIYSI